MGQVISIVMRWFFGGKKGNERQQQGKKSGNEQNSAEITSWYIDIDATPCQLLHPLFPPSHKEGSEGTIKEPRLGYSDDSIIGSGDSCTGFGVDCSCSLVIVEEDAGETIWEEEEAVKDVVVLEEEVLLSEQECSGKVEVIVERPVGVKGEGRSIGPYSSTHKMLLVGEGDFSFSTSLALAFGFAGNMVATSLDSEEFLSKNYRRAMSNILELTSRGCIVKHGVDATKMAGLACLNTTKFDRIVFNFPLAGFFSRSEPRISQIRKHQALVSSFMKNAKKMMNEDGEIHISHKSNGFFSDWKIGVLASNEGLRLMEVEDFNYKDYPGYNTKYGFGGDKNFNSIPSKSYKFGLKSSYNLFDNFTLSSSCD